MHLGFLATLYLLASPKTNRGAKGRQRYDPKLKQGKGLPKDGDDNQKGDPWPPPPLPTDPTGPFPTYFTCRHTYEDTLIEEITLKQGSAESSSPFPGLVRIENLDIAGFYEPIYAPQALPECVSSRSRIRSKDWHEL